MKISATVIVLTGCLFVGSSYAAQAYDWSGVYGGANIGYVHATQNWKLRGSQFWNFPLSDDGKKGFTFNNFDVGGHVGAQYQGKWLVLGAEGGVSKGPHDEQKERSPFYPTTDQWSADIHTAVKAVAKVGFAYNRFLGYAKGGYAGARVDTATMYPVPGIPIAIDKTHQWQNGWTVGGGVEYALTDHWILGAEYSYIDLGSQTHTSSQSPGFNAKVDAAMHEVLFRLSYKFNWF